MIRLHGWCGPATPPNASQSARGAPVSCHNHRIDLPRASVKAPGMTYPTPDDITAAAALIEGRVRKTPILNVEPGALGLTYPVTLKLEHTQVTGSFKVRGAFNNMLSRAVPAAGRRRGLGRQSRGGGGLCGDRAGACLEDLRTEIHRQGGKAAAHAHVRRRDDPDRGVRRRLHGRIRRRRREHGRAVAMSKSPTDNPAEPFKKALAEATA
jgi:hypothetical protein